MDIDTKRRIDTARDILVGKLPDPKSQVEQITIALIYKFMDDMDKQSEELGGKAKFFTGEFEKYSWSKIFDPRVSGFELVSLYTEAIERMDRNPNIPPLFREIFKNAYLPYRDPETLRMFLKVIGEFEYDHSERLGDSYEQLLSIMGSQGDAGQFRTPRHIIDFMVEVTDPQKTETILDPACGTAGFLIFSYNHILNKNRIDNNVNLSPEERANLVKNIGGYDISPDMVRIALVNMYLHGFQNPKIYEYDTLASEDRWNDYFDIILANPPFMSPRGGVRPHKRFSVQSKRSEVLFVDYIAEHLTPHGRGAVIVPEGIIFKSENAYKKLRRSLIENSLYAVVSLPAGVFNPYAGVKTSILFLNKNLAKKTDDILFVKISNDGFNLGAQRRKIKENDLPLALEIIQKYQQSINENKKMEFNANEAKLAHLVEKEKIAESGDYNLSGDRYKETMVYSGKWNFVLVQDAIKKVRYTNKIKKEKFLESGKYPIIDQSEEFISGYWNKKEDVYKITNPIIIFGDHTRCFKYIDFDFVIGADGIKILDPIQELKPKFFYYILRSLNIKNLGYSRHFKELKRKEIPLPPIEIQEQIVAELESYQKVIDGARQVVDNYKPTFKIDPDWEMVEFNKVCTLEYGKGLPKKDRIPGEFPVMGSNGISGYHNDYLIKGPAIIVGRKGSAGEVVWEDRNCFPIDTTYYVKLNDSKKVYLKYLYYIFKKLDLTSIKNGAGIPGLNRNDVYSKYKLPLPPLEIQKKIVTEIENEQKIIDANKELIKIYEQKIKGKIAEVWGE